MPSVPKRPAIYGAGVGVGVGGGWGAWIVTGTVAGLMPSSSTPSGRPLTAGVEVVVAGVQARTRRRSASRRRRVRRRQRLAGAAERDRDLVEPRQAGIRRRRPVHTTPTTNVRLETDGPIVAVTVTDDGSPSARLTSSGSWSSTSNVSSAETPSMLIGSVGHAT